MNVTDGTYGLYSSRVTTGDGNDLVFLNGSLQNSTVSLDGGNDILRLESAKAGNMLSRSLLDGGENDDINFDAGHLGDILSLGPALAGSVSEAAGLGGITSGNTKNFEALHLDLLNDADETMDSILSSLGSKGFTGDNAFKSVVITGDESDVVSLFSGSMTQSQSGVTLDNFEGLTFDRYTVMNGDDTLELFVQTGLI